MDSEVFEVLERIALTMEAVAADISTMAADISTMADKLMSIEMEVSGFTHEDRVIPGINNKLDDLLIAVESM